MAAILMVDDDAAFRTAVKRALSGAGHRVEEAADGRQALKALKAAQPDVVITDIIMPDSDGIELIAAVKKAHPGVRVLAISGRGNMGPLDLLKMASVVGADATLSKPLTGDDLLEAVEKLVG